MGQGAQSSLKAAGSRKSRSLEGRRAKDEGNSDVKRQAESDSSDGKQIYQLVNVKSGGGKLIEIIKDRARQQSQASSGSFGLSTERHGGGAGGDAAKGNRRQQSAAGLELDRRVDDQIRALVEPLLYNGGRGKLVPLARLWQARLCADRLGSSGGTSAPDELGERSHDQDDRPVMLFEDFAPGAGSKFQQSPLRTQAVSNRFRTLAEKLLSLFPMLINDIYTCDEYFGESSLHMAIVNEDVRIVKLLLDHGASVHERCLGSFFLPNDQKSKANGEIRRALEHFERDHDSGTSRGQLDTRALYDYLDKHLIDLHSNQFSNLQTNYEGLTYWGEYPLSFAASLGLRDCYKLLLAKGANPNKRDSNGNSTLHICVLSNRIDMFDLCYSSGANLNSVNKLGYTPLTLAAKLRRVNLFFHILTITRQVNWIFCNVGFVDIPLEGIDSIDTRDGSCNDHSVLSIVVSGVSLRH